MAEHPTDLSTNQANWRTKVSQFKDIVVETAKKIDYATATATIGVSLLGLQVMNHFRPQIDTNSPINPAVLSLPDIPNSFQPFDSGNTGSAPPTVTPSIQQNDLKTLYLPTVERGENVYGPGSLRSISVSFGGSDGNGVGVMRVNPDGTQADIQKIQLAARGHVVEPQIVVSPDGTRRYATWAVVVPNESTYTTYMVAEQYRPNGPIPDVTDIPRIQLTPDGQYYETHLMEMRQTPGVVLAISAGRYNTLAVTRADTTKADHVTDTRIIPIQSQIREYGIRTPFPLTLPNGITYAYYVTNGKLNRIPIFDKDNTPIDNAPEESVHIAGVDGFGVTQAHGAEDGYIAVAGRGSDGRRKLLLLSPPTNLTKENTSPLTMDALEIPGTPSVQQFGTYKNEDGVVVTFSDQPIGQPRQVTTARINTTTNTVKVAAMGTDAGDAFPSTLSQPEVIGIFKIGAAAKRTIN